ncbi:hypothetical protein HPB51_025078 [Rhipicephalus microplus]|uniref:Uncharacterized protein n=1 Tax=Rhipicephalus microplus TaxID=6941 RepID=A0A9J6DKH6_RHIMP|nr:hypothetical protein HPB51_025078 [Rhipicephalus microplus]
MFQPARAWQPQFDPPLPPFQTSRLESWFEEFAAALDSNSICIQASMYEIIDYHLPQDLKRRLAYLSWSPHPYDDLRDAVLQFYGIKRDGRHPPASINPLTERHSNPEYTTPPLDVPVLTPESQPPLSVTGSTRAAAPGAVGFSAAAYPPAPTAPGNPTIPAKPADPATESVPVPTAVEARDNNPTINRKLAAALHVVSFPNTAAPAAQTLADCQPDYYFSTNVSRGSQCFQDLLA